MSSDIGWFLKIWWLHVKNSLSKFRSWLTKLWLKITCMISEKKNHISFCPSRKVGRPVSELIYPGTCQLITFYWNNSTTLWSLPCGRSLRASQLSELWFSKPYRIIMMFRWIMAPSFRFIIEIVTKNSETSNDVLRWTCTPMTSSFVLRNRVIRKDCILFHNSENHGQINSSLVISHSVIFNTCWPRAHGIIANYHVLTLYSDIHCLQTILLIFKFCQGQPQPINLWLAH